MISRELGKSDFQPAWSPHSLEGEGSKATQPQKGLKCSRGHVEVPWRAPHRRSRSEQNGQCSGRRRVPDRHRLPVPTVQTHTHTSAGSEPPTWQHRSRCREERCGCAVSHAVLPATDANTLKAGRTGQRSTIPRSAAVLGFITDSCQGLCSDSCVDPDEAHRFPLVV